MAKASFQALSGTREMDFWYLWGQRPTKKDDKDFRNYEKKKSSQNPPANASSSKTQSSPAQSKKDQNSYSRQEKPRQQGQGQNTLAIGVNDTAIKKNKDKDKDKKNLSNIECYTYKLNGYYANKCSEKEPKN